MCPLVYRSSWCLLVVRDGCSNIGISRMYIRVALDTHMYQLDRINQSSYIYTSTSQSWLRQTQPSIHAKVCRHSRIILGGIDDFDMSEMFSCQRDSNELIEVSYAVVSAALTHREHAGTIENAYSTKFGICWGGLCLALMTEAYRNCEEYRASIITARDRFSSKK